MGRESVDKSIKKLGGAGAEDDEAIVDDGIADDAMELSDMLLKLNGDEVFSGGIVAHPVPSGHHHCTALCMSVPVWLQKQWISTVSVRRAIKRGNGAIRAMIASVALT